MNKLTDYKKYTWLIGIDPGVETGFCVWNRRQKFIRFIETLKIHEAMEQVKSWKRQETLSSKDRLLVRVEDPRLRKWFGKADREQLQGAGSIKRDAKIWEDFLTDLQIDFEMVPPKNNKTKMTADYFKKITGFSGRTNEHSRDAAMLVFGF